MPKGRSREQELKEHFNPRDPAERSVATAIVDARVRHKTFRKSNVSGCCYCGSIIVNCEAEVIRVRTNDCHGEFDFCSEEHALQYKATFRELLESS